MNLAWDDRRTRKFVTNVGLITTDGPYGPNIMAAEWTHHISYAPCLIAVNIRPDDATHANILNSSEFGANLCASDQSVISNIAGGSTGKEVDKMSVLKELGAVFYRAKRINVLMLEGAAMNAECKLLKAVEFGDHTMFVGEVLEISAPDKSPLVHHDGKNWQIGERALKPPSTALEEIDRLVRKYTRSTPQR